MTTADFYQLLEIFMSPRDYDSPYAVECTVLISNYLNIVIWDLQKYYFDKGLWEIVANNIDMVKT